MKSTTPPEQGTRREAEFFLWVSLWRAAKAILKARQKELHQYKLSPAKTSVLDVVSSHHDRVTPAEMSRELMRDPNTITELLISMEKDGMLRRIKDLPRKNMIRVELTDEGRNVYRRTTTDESYTEIFSILSKKEQQQLMSLLNRVTAKAQEYLK